MKVAFAGFDLLDIVLDTLEETCEIMEIFTCPVDPEFESNRHIRETAERLGIPCSQKPVKREDLTRLKEGCCDLFVSAGYYYRIPVEEGLRMVNIHPSLLPDGRGAWPMPVMLLSGMKEGGVTAHKLTEAFDQGDILLQERFPIEEQDTLEDVTRKIRRRLPAMIRRLTEDLDAVYQAAVPQTGGSYWKCPLEEEYPISPRMTAEEADRILRAFYGFGCIYQKGEEKWQLVRGRAASERQKKPEAEDAGTGFPLRDGWIYAERARKLE